jgi:succinate-semialdehyde dehydrogenase/glutarate-semialdehyde dehydrogenase
VYADVGLFIAGSWRQGAKGKQIDVVNPATEEVLARLAVAETSDLDAALAAAERGFAVWSKVPAMERSKLMRKAAQIFRDRAEETVRLLTLEQGKPLAQSQLECANGADMIEWFAEEARRTYGRVIPARADGVQQIVIKQPVGPVAAFTPWNFPVNQSSRKIAAALAAGCSMIIKGPEETPQACAALVRAFADAGLPAGVLNLVFGHPATISEYLIPHPTIKKVSFTGSTAVGKHLAELAGRYMKRATMELGGHAPAIVCEDADLDSASKLLCTQKYRNAGQVCISPTRFLVQDSVFDAFLGKFMTELKAIKVGDGLKPDTTMGPLAHSRRIEAIEAFVADAVKCGGTLRAGGKRMGNKGYFYEPTVLTDVPKTARVMNEEPFGPIALISRYANIDDALAEANRLPYGLAAYAYTRSLKTAAHIASSVESGMVSINHHGLGAAETPFGGVKDSGYGSEGGSEAIEAYLITKFVTQV